MQLSQDLWHRAATANSAPSRGVSGMNLPIGARKSNAGAFFAWLPLLLLLALTLPLRILFPPWVFMWALAIAIFFGLKWATWWRVRSSVSHSPWRAAAFLFAWPGTDARSFLDETRHPLAPRFAAWLWAILKTVLGALLLWFVARSWPATRPLLRGWTGMLGVIFLLHFGLFHILALFWQRLGFQAAPIMRAPLRARSLSEFWGKRWNLGFRQLAHDLIFQPLHKYIPAGFASSLVFVVSGLIHDLVISVPAHAGYGLPTAYFTLQGLGIVVERCSFGRQIGLGKGFRGFLFFLLIVAAPLFWLFPPPFVLRVIVPFMWAVHCL
jgi:hypothetical protein